MKKLLILALFFTTVFAQSQQKEELKHLVHNFITQTQQGNLDAAFDATYPKLFDIIPREQLKVVMKQMMKNEDFEMSFNTVNPQLQLDEIRTIDGNSYILIHYKNSMNLKFYDMTDIDPGMMKALFLQQFPDGTVNYDSEAKHFTIETPSRLLGINDQNTNGEWKFINANSSDKRLITLILDEKIIKEFGL